MKKNVKPILFGMSLVVAVVLAACGGQTDDAGEAAQPATAASEDEEQPAAGGQIEPIFRDRNELAEQYPAPNTLVDPTKTYTATIITVKGDIHLNLFADKVPITVNSFAYLACEGFYDQTTFHRVIPDFMAQAGDPTGTGSGGPGYRFTDEFHPDLRHGKPGMLSMANSGVNTNGSQFFITYVPTPNLDGLHAVFGEVADEDSMNVVLDIRPRDPLADPNPGDVIITIELDEDGQSFC